MGEKYCSLVVNAARPFAFFYYIELSFESYFGSLRQVYTSSSLQSFRF